MTMQIRANRSTAVTLVLALAFVAALAAEQRAGAQGRGVGIESEDPPESPGDDSFDHVGTRFIITGSHEGVACESCHSMGVFRGTPTQCGFCHDGSGMRAESGKPLDHIPTSNQCDDCHTTFTWLEVRFEHSGVSGACMSCHNGMQAEGKPLGHIVTNLDCDFCHNTYVWQSIRFDHSGATGPCSSCHNGTDATGTPSGHFMSSEECDACHTTRYWEPDIFRHMSSNYPGDHARDLDCTRCHPGNSDPVVYTDDPGLAPDCGGCHRNDFDPGPHKQYENPDHRYTADELRDCSGACHIYTDSTLTVIKERRNREHRVSDRDFD